MGHNNSRWILDSGCSRHMTGELGLLKDFKAMKGSYVNFAGDKAETVNKVETCLVSKATEQDTRSWHRRMGHIHIRKMNHLVHNYLVEGVPVKQFKLPDVCLSCKKGKQKRRSCKTKTVFSIDKPLELLHKD